MKVIYEGAISGYSFLMVDPNTIEIWSDTTAEAPDSYIFLKDGEVKSEKDFHIEISIWHMRNCPNG